MADTVTSTAHMDNLNIHGPEEIVRLIAKAIDFKGDLGVKERTRSLSLGAASPQHPLTSGRTPHPAPDRAFERTIRPVLAP